MRKSLLVSAAAIAAAGLVAMASAAEASDDGPGMGFAGGRPMMGARMMMHGHHGGAMLGTMVARFDANGDGSITRSEIDSGLAKDFKTADTDRNNKVSSAEMKAFMEARHAEMMAKMGMPSDDDADKGRGHEGMRHDMMDPVKHLDWNRDGSLSLEELSAPVRLAAMRFDRDGNGTITATDLLRHHGGMGE